MKFVQRRAGRYEFRFPLPDDLAGQPVPHFWPDALTSLANARAGHLKTELIRSLQTNDRLTAERRVLPHIAEAHGLVDQARRVLRDGPAAGFSPDQVVAIARDHEIHLLGADEAIRAQGMGLDLSRDENRLHDGLGMTDDDLQAYRMLVCELDRQTRDQAARMRPGEVIGAFVNRAVEQRGVLLRPDDPVWRQLELAFVNAQRSAIAGIRKRLDGDEVATPERPSEPRGKPLTAALELWSEAGNTGARKPQPSSVAEAQRAARRFVELHGDLPITAITKAHARAFRDALARLPKVLPARLAGLPLPEVLKQDLSKYPRRNAQTINKTLGLLSGVLARAERATASSRRCRPGRTRSTSASTSPQPSASPTSPSAQPNWSACSPRRSTRAANGRWAARGRLPTGFR